MQKFYWNNHQPPPGLDLNTLTLAVNHQEETGKEGGAACVRVVEVLDTEEDRQPGQARMTAGSTNRVVVKLGERERELNRTWNERTGSSYRGAKCNIFNHHDYENVYTHSTQHCDDTPTTISDKTQKDRPGVSASSARNTPRSRKKKRQEARDGRVYRSKSCERVPGMPSLLDKLSEKLSSNSESPSPPSTPTPSLLQSVAARAIPCVDIKPPCGVSSNARLSPTPTESSIYGSGTGSTFDGYKDIFRPAANLADRMRGRMEYVNRKIKIIRSRSAERLRGYMRPEILTGEEKRSQLTGVHHLHLQQNYHQRNTHHRPQQYHQYKPDQSLPVLGQARALVSCSPSPYDKDILRYQAGDIIDITHMNPNGLWRGRCGDKTGQFKFINVELVPQSRRRHRSRGRSLSKMSGQCISSIADVLRALDMSDYLPVFVLNGYEDLTLLKDLDEAELDYLGINNLHHRERLINMARVIFPLGESIVQTEVAVC